jgi:hypothetical protein
VNTLTRALVEGRESNGYKPDDVWLKIALTSGSKPISSILSASSRTYAKKKEKKIKNIYHTIISPSTTGNTIINY